MIALYLSLALIIVWMFIMHSREPEYFTEKEKLKAAIKKFI